MSEQDGKVSDLVEIAKCSGDLNAKQVEDQTAWLFAGISALYTAWNLWFSH